jgi:predicted dehydrogenase
MNRTIKEFGVNIGIIGAGEFAGYHIHAIRNVEGLRVVAASRRDRGQLDNFCKLHSLIGHTNYHDLLDDDSIDAVLIATPHHLHTEIVEQAATKGKHILLEKPLAENTEGVNRIVKAVKENGIRFMVGFSHRFSRANHKARELVATGAIGEIVSGVSALSKLWMVPERREWHLSRKTGGGMWLTNGIHLLDRLCFLMDSRIEAISANIGTRFHNQDADDYATAYLKFSSGVSGMVSVFGYSNGGPIEETILIGTKGMIKINQHTGVLLGLDDGWKHIVDTGSDNFHFDALAKEWTVFRDYVLTGSGEGVITMDYATHIMDAVFAGERSSLEGNMIHLDTHET